MQAASPGNLPSSNDIVYGSRVWEGTRSKALLNVGSHCQMKSRPDLRHVLGE